MEHKRATLAAILIVLLGGLVVVAAKFLWPYATQKYEAYKQVATSDSRVSTTIRMGGDGYLGYWFITAPDTGREAARRGIAIAFRTTVAPTQPGCRSLRTVSTMLLSYQ